MCASYSIMAFLPSRVRSSRLNPLSAFCRVCSEVIVHLSCGQSCYTNTPPFEALIDITLGANVYISDDRTKKSPAHVVMGLSSGVAAREDLLVEETISVSSSESLMGVPRCTFQLSKKPRSFNDFIHGNARMAEKSFGFINSRSNI